MRYKGRKTQKDTLRGRETIRSIRIISGRKEGRKGYRKRERKKERQMRVTDEKKTDRYRESVREMHVVKERNSIRKLNEK